MGSLLYSQMEWMEGEEATLSLLVSTYVQFICTLLANDHPMADAVIEQLVHGVIVHHKARFFTLFCTESDTNSVKK